MADPAVPIVLLESGFGARDVVTIIALVVGPVAAVLITLWAQSRTEKRNAKQRLFAALMAHRKSNPPAVEWANALNLIDVVYADRPNIVELWHEAYGILNSPGGAASQAWNHKYIEMLSAMAQSLGYKRLTQTDIDKFYAPQAHWDAIARQAELQTEFLRVLKATQTLRMEHRDSDNED